MATWIMGQLVLVFLIDLNDHMHGTFRQAFTGLLILATLAMIVVAFVLWGWIEGIALAVLTALAAGLLRAPASKLAGRISASR